MTAAVLRAATDGDVPVLARLGHDSFVAKFGHLYRPQDLAAFLAKAFTPSAIAAELANLRLCIDDVYNAAGRVCAKQSALRPA